MPRECSRNALSKVIKNMKIRMSNYTLDGVVRTKHLRATALFFCC